jgi:outer membrane protein
MSPSFHIPPIAPAGEPTQGGNTRFRNFGVIRSLLCVALLIMSANRGNAQADPQTRFTLQEAITYALEHSPNVLNAKLDASMSSLKTKELLGMAWPQINASFDIKDFVELPTSLLPAEIFGGAPGSFIPIKFGTQFNATAGVSVSQLVFNSDFFVGVSATRMLSELMTVNVMRSEIEVKTQVAKAYYNVLVTDERLKLLDANVERLTAILTQTRELNKEGFVESIDVERLEVAFNNLMAEQEKINRLAGLATTVLKFQMGLKLDQPLTLTDRLDLANLPLPESNPAAPEAIYSNRIEYTLLQTQLGLNGMELKRYRLSYLPSAYAYGSLNTQFQRNDLQLFGNRWYPVAVIGLTVNMPIFDGFQKQRRIQQAKLNIQKTENTIQNLENAIDMEATVAWTNYQNALISMNTQKKNIDLASHIYDVTQIKFKEGVGSNLEVVNAETSMKEAQTNYMNAVYEYYVSKVDLEKALGMIK